MVLMMSLPGLRHTVITDTFGLKLLSSIKMIISYLPELWYAKYDHEEGAYHEIHRCNGDP